MPDRRCPLCGVAGEDFVTTAAGRHRRCPACRLIWRQAADRPAPAAEQAHYALHENDPADAGYRAFLERLAVPLARRLSPGMRGLDYGCGPGPALSLMLREAGWEVADYDPFFAPDHTLLERRYDFITCSEVIEHFHAPGREFARLDGLLRPGGWLGVMTEPRDPARDFAAWWYQRDPTHVCFYEAYTLNWIARRFGWAVEFPSRTVALFHKPARA